MKKVTVYVESVEKGIKEEDIHIKAVLVVGYGGRDLKKVQEHIDELAEIGVAPPSTIPAVYPMQLSNLSFEQAINVARKETSGEAEYVLFHNGAEWLITLGSDHTDRFLEIEDIQLSKESCPKPLATKFWRLEDVQNHWDQLYLRSWITDEQGRRKYQEHDLTSLLSVNDLLNKLEGFGYKDISNTVIFSGTVPTLEGFVYGSEFEYELADPVLNRKIESSYSIAIQEVRV
ncbi:DUF2848 family protein [Priestia aryabhattai]|uniref:DUF2848 family protein n=1 Tax=Priestia aryabhattai TaxID=412384 RepID=UPI0025A4CAB7|nr:DUF2848 family protein [Priestia aryabhattai]WJN42747.1 DUF2848 family protein [Priestia aryabhattai]